MERPAGGGPSPPWTSILALFDSWGLVFTSLTRADAGDDFVLDLVSAGCGADLVLDNGT